MKGLSICAGTNLVSNCEVKREISESIPHEKYGAFKHDIALMRFESPLEFSESIMPIQIATKEVPVHSDVVICGWGKTSNWSNTSDKLKYTTLKSVRKQDCSIEFDGLICLGHGTNHGACNVSSHMIH